MIMKVFEKKIGNLFRRVYLYRHDWGIYAVVADDNTESKLTQFSKRNFKICKTSPTIEDCEKRAKKWFKID